MNENSKTPIAAVIAMLAVTLAVVAMQNFARRDVSSIERDGNDGPTDASAWLADIEGGADHISPQELSERMVAADQGLLLIDVRPGEEYREFHLPGAVRASVPEVVGTAWSDRIADASLVVLYSNGPAHPGQAWVELRRRGVKHVRVLDGGLTEFRRAILTPPSLRGLATPEQAAADAARWRMVRDWILGVTIPPRSLPIGDPDELKTPTLVSAAWLRERLSGVRLIDTRNDANAFAAGHLPGAMHVTPSMVRVRHGDRDLHLRTSAERARLFGNLGITRDTPVVLMGDERLADTAMVATALSTLGHRRLAILDGGIAAWLAIRGPLVAAMSRPEPAEYVPAADSLTISIDEVAAAVAKQEVQVIDVRPAAAFTGKVSTEARPGHVPGAINRPSSSEYDAVGRWRDLRQIAEEHRALGIDPARPVVVMCRTGHTATATAFLMQHLLGYRNVRWFNGSWTEWAERADLPAATGGDRDG